MALKTYGKEVYRLEKLQTTPVVGKWLKRYLSIRETGVVLEKKVCLLKSRSPEGQERKVTWGWKPVTYLRKGEIDGYCQQKMVEGWELTYGQRRWKNNLKSPDAASGD